VRQIQKITGHFKPFLKRAMEVMNDESSYSQIIIFNLVRLLVIFICVGAAYALARILQAIIGREIVVEEEIVIVHEYKSKEEAELAQRQQNNRKGGRDKKSKPE
jgi:hypothetical protein